MAIENEKMENPMSLENKGKISILIFIIFLASIIPFCMISSYRETIVQGCVQELSIARQENLAGLNKVFNSASNKQIVPDKKRGTR
jgi:hypothetical protein